MNIFYAPPEQISGNRIELKGQEARHAAKVLRYREGDSITVVDGAGGWYEGIVRRIEGQAVSVEIDTRRRTEPPRPERVLAFGILKKRDRMEFAVEKAVELGVSEIALFRGEHTVKENVRMDRLETTVRSAMKQSLRAYLPKVGVFDGLEEVLKAYSGYKPLIAHKKINNGTEKGIEGTKPDSADKLLLLVGPEGGFSDEEVELACSSTYGGEAVSLGRHRLRTETAAVTLLSRFIRL